MVKADAKRLTDAEYAKHVKALGDDYDATQPRPTASAEP